MKGYPQLGGAVFRVGCVWLGGDLARLSLFDSLHPHRQRSNMGFQLWRYPETPMTCFLFRNHNILPEKELHGSLQVLIAQLPQPPLTGAEGELTLRPRTQGWSRFGHAQCS